MTRNNENMMLVLVAVEDASRRTAIERLLAGAVAVLGSAESVKTTSLGMFERAAKDKIETTFAALVTSKASSSEASADAARLEAVMRSMITAALPGSQVRVFAEESGVAAVTEASAQV